MRVRVYSTGPQCPQCGLTLKVLDEVGIAYELVDLRDDANADAREFVTDELGYTQAPIVVVDEEPQNHWSGFQPDLIKRLAAARVSAVPS